MQMKIYKLFFLIYRFVISGEMIFQQNDSVVTAMLILKYMLREVPDLKSRGFFVCLFYYYYFFFLLAGSLSVWLIRCPYNLRRPMSS